MYWPLPYASEVSLYGVIGNLPCTLQVSNGSPCPQTASGKKTNPSLIAFVFMIISKQMGFMIYPAWFLWFIGKRPVEPRSVESGPGRRPGQWSIPVRIGSCCVVRLCGHQPKELL